MIGDISLSILGSLYMYYVKAYSLDWRSERGRKLGFVHYL